jgi:hypothetical protein
MPESARFFPDVPTIIGDLTNEDGSFKTKPLSD